MKSRTEGYVHESVRAAEKKLEQLRIEMQLTDLEYRATMLRYGIQYEQRANPYHDPKTGRFTDAPSRSEQGIDKSNGNDIMKSGEYDFLEDINGAENISSEQAETLDEIVSVIPQKHLSAIEKTIQKVDVVPNRGYCSYNPVTKTLTLDPDRMNGSIIHEYGHVLADAYDIYNDKEFLNILSDGLNLSDYSDVVSIKNPYVNGEYLFAIKSKKFLNIYQGRIYIDRIEDWTAQISAKSMQEYFSVGFNAYFNSRKELVEKDFKLYYYIKRLLHDE